MMTGSIYKVLDIMRILITEQHMLVWDGQFKTHVILSSLISNKWKNVTRKPKECNHCTKHIVSQRTLINLIKIELICMRALVTEPDTILCTIPVLQLMATQEALAKMMD